MKKSLLLMLIALLFIISACAKEKNKDNGENPAVSGAALSETVKENDTSDANSSDITGSGDIAAPTSEPAPTPFPTDNVEEYDGYGFVFHETEPLSNSPESGSYELASLEKDAQLHLIGKYGDKWYYAEYNGVKGFIKRAMVATASGYINADEVKLRSGAGTSKEQKQLLNQQTELYIISRVNDWFRVVLADGSYTTGYVFSDYVSYHDAYVKADDVRIRTEPNTECKTLTRIEKGKRVSVICEYNGWCKITVDEFTGFMSKDYIEYSPTVKKLARERGYLRESGVNFREGPSTECKSLGRLAKFSPVYITGETDEWYRVEFNEKEGYVSKDFIEFGKLVVYVTGQDVNLRAGPGTGYDLLTKVRQNSVFEIIGSEGDWLKGIVNHNTGYIRSDYLSSDTVNGGEKKNEFTEADIALAAKVVYLEAYGRDGYRAVANVIYNRVKSHMFPNTVRGVVYEKNQFSVVNHSRFDSIRPSAEAYNAVREVLNGGLRPLPFNVLFFHIHTAGKNWGSDKVFYKTIGDNSFFRYVG